MIPLASEDRFWVKVLEDPETGCWLWRPSRVRTAYGKFDRWPAHRVAYELVVGLIPDGLTIDHLCKTPACVNPAHLEPVTIRENVLRGDGPTALNARKTHCKHGHELTPDNLHITPEGYRRCIACRRQSNRDYRARKAGPRRGVTWRPKCEGCGQIVSPHGHALSDYRWCSSCQSGFPLEAWPRHAMLSRFDAERLGWVRPQPTHSETER